MKLSDIARGTKILIQCPSCLNKRSVIFKDKYNYERDILRLCHTCATSISLPQRKDRRMI